MQAAKDTNVCGSSALPNPFLSDFQEPTCLIDATTALPGVQPSSTPVLDLFTSGEPDIIQQVRPASVSPQNISPEQAVNIDLFNIAAGDFVKSDLPMSKASPVTEMIENEQTDIDISKGKEEGMKPKGVPPPRPPPPTAKPPPLLVPDVPAPLPFMANEMIKLDDPLAATGLTPTNELPVLPIHPETQLTGD